MPVVPVSETDSAGVRGRQLWVAYMAGSLPPSAVRGLLLLLAALAATRAGEGAGSRRCRAAGPLVVGLEKRFSR